ncbi:hypothetical protein A2U01_0100778, partial [Trifolium medium]|nr:hypothetical protein [Trifolium medium]
GGSTSGAAVGGADDEPETPFTVELEASPAMKPTTPPLEKG